MNSLFAIRSRLVLAFVLVWICFDLRCAVADPSLDPDDYYEVKTDIYERKDQAISLLRDHENPARFYYIPSAPQVSRVTDQRGNVPEFTLLRYQFTDNGERTEGGVLQFTVELALPDQSRLTLRQNLAAMLNEQGETLTWQEIDLAPIPLRNSKVHFYSPSNGSFIASAERADGIAPAYVTQKMPYSLTLSRNGTAVFDELIKGPTGLACAYEIEHTGMSPEAGFYVEVDWQKVLDLFSTDESISSYRSQNHVFWQNSSEDNTNIQDIKNRFTSTGAVVGKAYGDDSVVPTEELLKYMDSVLQRVYQQVYSDSDPAVPESLDPATATPADASAEEKANAEINNFASLHAKIQQSRKERFEFNVRETQTVKTVFGSFVGIGGWIASNNWLDGSRSSGLSKEGETRLKEWGLLAYASDSGFENAYFSLPPVYPAKDWELAQVRLEMQLLGEDGAPLSINSETTHSASWYVSGRESTTGSWMDSSKKPMNCLLFPLGAVGFERESLGGLTFRNRVKLVTFGGDKIEYVHDIECESGDLDVGNPFEPLEPLSIEPRGLRFEDESDRVKRRLGGGQLVEVEVFLSEPHSGRKRTVRWTKGNSEPFSFLLSPDPNNDKNLRCDYTVSFLIETEDFDEVPCKPIQGFFDRHASEDRDEVFRPNLRLSMKNVIDQIKAAKEQ